MDSMSASPTTRSVLFRFSTLLDVVEKGFILLLVVLLLLAGLAQFFLRNIFHTGLLWLEPMSRYLVLWIAFAGAVRAAKENRHIRIDIAPRFLHGRGKLLVHALTSIGAAITCLVLAYWAWDFLKIEREFGGLAFLKIPTWIALAAIPLGFFLTALRCGGRGLADLISLIIPRFRLIS